MTRQRTNQIKSLMAVLTLAVAGAACSAEKISQSIAENAIENACENEGTQCNVDIDGDAIKFETADGSMTIDENGNAVVVGADGQVVNVDAGADGAMTVTDGDGSVVVAQNDDTMTITGSDGEASFTTGTEIPAEFPSSIQLPDGRVAGSTVMGDASTPNGVVMLNLVVPGEIADVAAAVTAGVIAGGYTEVSKMQSADGHYYAFEGNGQNVALAVMPDAASGGQMVSYSIAGTG